MKGNYKTSDRDKCLLLLSTKDVWTNFKLHTMRLVDNFSRSRLNTLIASFPDVQAAVGLEISLSSLLLTQIFKLHCNVFQQLIIAYIQ